MFRPKIKLTSKLMNKMKKSRSRRKKRTEHRDIQKNKQQNDEQDKRRDDMKEDNNRCNDVITMDNVLNEEYISDNDEKIISKINRRVVMVVTGISFLLGGIILKKNE